MTPEPMNFDPAEWAALYAAGALTPLEAAVFESFLAAGDLDCAAELAALDPAIGGLAAGVEPVAPPPEIRERLLRQIESEPTWGWPGLERSETLESAAPGLPVGPAPATPPPPSPSSAPDDTPPSRGNRLAGLLIQYAADARWRNYGAPGVQWRLLHRDRQTGQYTALLRCEPGAKLPEHVHTGPEECYVLEGDIQIGDITLGPGDYQRAEVGSEHAPQFTRGGCVLLLMGTLAASN